ncbi:MAG TPA: hypothetical protein VFQ61_29255 [Polyangiaceae bacterium]|nr:hypothetical protein [Polyangiaceae bacterium]
MDSLTGHFKNMQAQDAPEDTRQKLHELMALVQRSLDTSSTPHLTAISLSSMSEPAAPDSTVDGGVITAHVKPSFKYDRLALADAHRELLLSGGGQLFAAIIRAQRESPAAQWTLTARLVTRAEHEALAQSRKAIDVEVEALLREHFGDSDQAELAFGRGAPGESVRVIREGRTGQEQLPPTPELMQLLQRTEQLYREAGLNLIVADWRLWPSGFEFCEYFE